tara:strand:- start:1257 stop:1850 length:594 start_codon:yes stop_codon:yes gene_type:complete
VKTPDDFRRDDVKNVFKKRLGSNIVELRPISIRISETSDLKSTMVDLCFEKSEGEVTKKYNFENQPGSGFVDSVYKTCYNCFAEEYASLKNISLVGLIVKPIFSLSACDSKTDAKTDVVFRLETKQHGLSEFRHRSRSIVYSSFSSILDAFQFYMNCDKAFSMLRFVLEDANTRRRSDIVESCRSDMSVLTRVNNYA